LKRCPRLEAGGGSFIGVSFGGLRGVLERRSGVRFGVDWSREAGGGSFL
jgi:hypothetical protein